jgi:predicted O-linked N-acetylglucosamine transferase (SPINDLY family)
MLPLLSHRDKERYEVYCYTDVRRTDALTDALKAQVNIWQQTSGLNDEDLARLIQNDKIDILIDLTMHMKGSRLLAFARKPAPVQVTYLAYCSTTGLDAIDYRLSDPHLDPPGMDESIYSEKTIRLPRTYWCYPRPEGAPEVGPLPYTTNGFVTFGCLNNYCKVTSKTLAMWRDLLVQVPDSRLIVHALEGRHRHEALEYFAAGRVDPQRVEFVGQMPLADYLAQYLRIDIVLDPFPYGGGTTTCDALYMGVPVVTLKGDTAVSRGGASILTNLGHCELIAETQDQYVGIAIDMAGDVAKLAELHLTLRKQMERSPLMDAVTFTRDIETAFRTMWMNWCGERATGPGRRVIPRQNA